jgi:hypothetical protein
MILYPTISATVQHDWVYSRLDPHQIFPDHNVMTSPATETYLRMMGFDETHPVRVVVDPTRMEYRFYQIRDPMLRRGPKCGSTRSQKS